jgi:hypothetical protein
MDVDQPPVVWVSARAGHALAGAALLEVGEWWLRRTTWEELELVQHRRAHPSDPRRHLRHVLD